MCGILGIFKLNGDTLSTIEIKHFTSSLIHRGPDGSDIYINKDKTIGLGHTRTTTFDLTNSGTQPMSYSNERYWITFNGEIYNFIELKKELQSLGHIFKSETDTEVVIAAYSAWGEACRFKFNGDWAFAIWDNKEKNLFISSDRFGIRPIYYIHHKNYFVFASELKAFMYLPLNMRPEFDEGFLLWLGKNAGSINTFLKDVLLLPGGHQININQRNLFSYKKWWRTIEHQVDVPKKYVDQTTYFKELFFNACKIRMRSDVPLASCLSGGIDSSSIVSAISEIKETSPTIERCVASNHNVYICEFSEDSNSEIQFAQQVLKNKNINPNYIKINKSSIEPEQLIQSLIDREDIDADSIQLSLLYKRMREDGTRISLDGSTPDETLGGYWADPMFAIKDSILSFNIKRFKDLAFIYSSINNVKVSNSFKLKLIIKNLFGEQNIIHLTSMLKNNNNLSLIDKNKYNLIKKTKLLYPEIDKPRKLDNFNKHLYAQFHYLNSPSLFQKWDKLSMAKGVVSRAPFADPNLITYIFSLPSKAKIGNGYTKKILRDSMRGLVPETVLNRREKRGFSSPTHWYSKNMNSFINDYISSQNFLNSDTFNAKMIRKDYENNNLHIYGNPSKFVLRYIQASALINSFKEIRKLNNVN